MPPKAKPAPAPNTQIHIVSSSTAIDSVYVSLSSARARVQFASEEDIRLSIATKTLIGGTIIPNDSSPPQTAAKPKTIKNAIKSESADKEAKPKTQSPIKKTKTPAEQRAANAEKAGKPKDAKLPDNVKALLKKGGKVFEGQMVCVTGVPPTFGRKNTERLVEAFGARLTRSLSRNTGWVVVGNDAGPTKLEKIAELELRTLDEDELINLLEKGGSGAGKRGADEDEEEEEEEEKPKPKAKRQKK